MADQLAITELWPLSDEEAAQKIVAFLRDLEIERKTGGTGLDLLPLVQEMLSPRDWKRIEIPEAEASYWMRDDLPEDSPAQEPFDVVSGILRDVGQGERQEPSKQKLLEKYAQKEPNTFHQVDGWADYPPGDTVMIPDEEGDVMMATETEELMSTCPDVRVLILPGTDKEEVSRLLRKIAGWIESSP